MMDNVKEEWRDIEISGIAYDSRDVKTGPPGTGFMFVARKGLAQDGHKYIDDAIKNGAVAIVVERGYNHPARLRGATIVVEDGREALADISDKFYGSPSSKLNLIGITGTNGKTTTTMLLKSIYEEYGIKTGVIGTINHFIGDKKYKSERTTPESLDINKLLSSMVEEGVETVIAEVSSHALALDRVRGMDFDIAGLTNISRDHLDFHNNMEDYISSKERLFRGEGLINHAPTLVILNKDDTYFERFRKCTNARVISYGKEDADITGKIVSSDINGMEVEIKLKTQNSKLKTNGNIRIQSHITGMHNLYNILLAFTISREDDVPPIFIKRGIEKLKGIDGRFEVIEQRVIIDYAHTPASLESVLKSARTFTNGRVICIFGCGGNRDKGKRPIMGEISTRVADLTIITSDNPRDENPLEIIEEIIKGVKGSNNRKIKNQNAKCKITNQNLKIKREYVVIVDRREAIERGIRESREGDIVAIAGKGHEDYQIIGDKVIPFSDKKEVEKILMIEGGRSKFYLRNRT